MAHVTLQVANSNNALPVSVTTGSAVTTTGAVMKKLMDFRKSKIVSIGAKSERKNIMVNFQSACNARIAPASHVMELFKIDGLVQQRELLPNGDQVAVDWPRDVGAARAAWGELTEAELLATNGHLPRLSQLVQKRYATTQEEAETLVRIFF